MDDYGQPLDAVHWIERDLIRANDYNPNRVPRVELRLLKISILQDGWTQPIVVHRESMVIIDGEHRWTVAADPEVAKLTGGRVPVVFVEGDRARRMMSTIRHNRARGEHAVLPMAEIVKALLQGGTTREDVMFLLQMEGEEVERLAERAGLPEVVSRASRGFNKGWVPQ